MEVVVTGELTEWFYIYMAYSIENRAAMIYLRFKNREGEQPREEKF